MDNRLFGPAQAPLDNPVQVTEWLARHFGQRFNRLGLRSQIRIAIGAGAVVSQQLLNFVQGTASLFSPVMSDRKRKYSEVEVDSGGSFHNLRGSAQMEEGRFPPGTPAETRINALSSSGSASSAADTAHGKGRETRVVTPPRHICFGIPDYFTTKLMYVNGSWLTLQPALNSSSADYEIRVNSVYDTLSLHAGEQQPTWRNFFAALYTHYTVLNMEYHVTFEQKANTTNGTDIDVMYRTYGSIVPGSYGQSHLSLQTDPMVKWKTLYANADKAESVTFSGNIDHDDYINNIQEVQDDSKDQIWSPVGADPALTHVLRFMPRRRTGTSPEGSSLLYISHKLIYTVQFRQLQQAYYFTAS